MFYKLCHKEYNRFICDFHSVTKETQKAIWVLKERCLIGVEPFDMDALLVWPLFLVDLTTKISTKNRQHFRPITASFLSLRNRNDILKNTVKQWWLWNVFSFSNSKGNLVHCMTVFNFDEEVSHENLISNMFEGLIVWVRNYVLIYNFTREITLSPWQLFSSVQPTKAKELRLMRVICHPWYQ